MEKVFANAEELAGTIKEYINNRIASVKLNTAEKSAAVIANIIAGTIVTLFFLLCLIMASIALALILGNWIGIVWLGFLIIAGIFLLTGIIVWKTRVNLIRLRIMNALLKQLFNTEEDEED